MKPLTKAAGLAAAAVTAAGLAWGNTSIVTTEYTITSPALPKGFHGLCTADDQTNDTLDPLTALTSDWLPTVKKWLKQTL